MKLHQLIDELQQIAHMGHAQDEILFTDLTNDRGTKMVEALRPKMLDYTACNGKIALRIHDERAPDCTYIHLKPTCVICGTDANNVEPLYKYTDDTKVWNYARSLTPNTKIISENSWFCPACAKELMETVHD